ncbi:MAG: pantoate--beta-alanine ligase [Acidobacteriota bacterium]|nr:pantoate--beta-alanine ligase [Acidobacteriota bacterium]MDE3147111.1 pantoate--beta-alanine ligase [Acidobacteriota bacterium]
MRRLSSVAEWRDYARSVRAAGRTVGVVPTMGALHDGHLSLVRRARDHGDLVLLTSFVNPRQFSDALDLARYPRTPDADADLAAAAGVDALVAPSLAEMWPDHPRPTLTTVSVGELAAPLEGASRPGHFDGVASVVAKLLIITGPARAYFGEKDYQQLVVVRQMVRDLAFDVEVVGCATLRGEDGLALSSRNARLSAEGRVRARGLSRALRAAITSTGPPSRRRDIMREVMESAGIDVAYADVVDPATLTPWRDDDYGTARAMVAGFVEGVRLIDNDEILIEKGRGHALGH